MDPAKVIFTFRDLLGVRNNDDNHDCNARIETWKSVFPVGRKRPEKY